MPNQFSWTENPVKHIFFAFRYSDDFHECWVCRQPHRIPLLTSYQPGFMHTYAMQSTPPKFTPKTSNTTIILYGPEPD